MYRKYEIVDADGKILAQGIGGYGIFTDGIIIIDNKLYVLVCIAESKGKIIFTVKR